MSSTQEYIWENVYAKAYDDEQDAWYVVRVHPGQNYTEWNILSSFDYPEDAIRSAQEFTENNPGVPVRVERNIIQ